MRIGTEDEPRNSGRTTRMVETALKYAVENDANVCLVFRTERDGKNVMERLKIGSFAMRHVRIISSAGDGMVDMGSLSIRGMRMGDPSVFFDHSVIYSHFRRVIDEWGRFTEIETKNES